MAVSVVLAVVTEALEALEASVVSEDEEVSSEETNISPLKLLCLKRVLFNFKFSLLGRNNNIFIYKRAVNAAVLASRHILMHTR